MEDPLYAVCQHCEFLRAFGSTTRIRPPERCPSCGHEVNVHPDRERFPSAHVARISRELHRSPALHA